VFAKAGHTKHLYNPARKIAFYYAEATVDGRREQSDQFKTRKEAKEWLRDLFNRRIPYTDPEILVRRVAPPKRRRTTRRKHNPGEAWHRGEASAAHRARRSTSDADESLFFSGVETAHTLSASAAKALKMNTRPERTLPPARIRKNPIGVFGIGNPPKSIRATVAGVVYSRCLEIRAEKTKFKPGLYRHPFARKSGVQILALDNGDLLIHSTRGVNLWGPV